jgi:hypothetical protein
VSGGEIAAYGDKNEQSAASHKSLRNHERGFVSGHCFRDAGASSKNEPALATGEQCQSQRLKLFSLPPDIGMPEGIP